MMAELRLGKIKFCVGLFAVFAMCYTSLFVFTMSLRLFTIRLVDYSATANIQHRSCPIGCFGNQTNQSNSMVMQHSYVMDTSKHTKLLFNDKDDGSFRPIHDQYYFEHGEWNKKPLHESGSGQFINFYLYGASVCNSSGSSFWDELRIYGQWLKRFADESSKRAKCCIKYIHGTIITVNSRKRMPNRNHVEIQDFYFVCAIPRRNDTNLPTKVTIVTGNTTCWDNDIPYIKPFYSQKEPGKLGISSKIAYGSLSSETIIEWVEAMKHLGVDKIITYADGSLNEAALKTLQYYERTGLVEVFPYNQPAKDIFPRDISQKMAQAYADARVVVFDTSERLRGYKYLSIIDMDEFLIPSKGRSLKQFMDDLVAQEKRRKKKAAGFFFKTSYFIKSWGVVNGSSDLDIGKYLNRTASKPDFDNRKAIVVNDNVPLYQTHLVLPKTGYDMINCSENEAYIRHYRNCRAEWQNQCMDLFERVTTYEMIKWANVNIANSVRQVRKILFG